MSKIVGGVNCSLAKDVFLYLKIAFFDLFLDAYRSKTGVSTGEVIVVQYRLSLWCCQSYQELCKPASFLQPVSEFKGEQMDTFLH